jgi:AcrR family transcriptional regulator
MPKVLTSDELNDFRGRLCAAAEHLFAEHGAAAVTMRQLATALGVSAMTPYRYFKDKDAILATVRAAAFNRFAAKLETAYQAAPAGDALAASLLVADAYVAFALNDSTAYRLMFDFAQPNEADYADLQAAAARARRTMTAHVSGLVTAGLLRGDADLIGHAFWAMLHGTIVLQMAGKLSAGIDAGVLREASLRALLAGFGLGMDC